MNSQQLADDDTVLRRYEYDDGPVIVADLGPGNDGTVDVVDGTAIVVLGDHQVEIDLPMGPARAFMKNGVVTIEVEE